MSRTVLHTEHAPAAIGPYSQGIQTDDFIFVSGQIPVDPVTGKVEEKVAAQAKQVMENVRSVLLAADADLSQIVKTTIFLTDIDDFQAVNEVYASYFTHNAPRSSNIRV